jgi:hypothetical protein
MRMEVLRRKGQILEPVRVRMPPATKEASVCDAACSVDVEVARGRSGLLPLEKGSQDREGDGLFRLPVPFSVVTFDAADETL